jgi:hypothetical protein
VVRARLSNLFEVLNDHIVKDGVVVAELLARHPEVNVKLLVQLINGLSVILNARVFDDLIDNSLLISISE